MCHDIIADASTLFLRAVTEEPSMLLRVPGSFFIFVEYSIYDCARINASICFLIGNCVVSFYFFLFL